MNDEWRERVREKGTMSERVRWERDKLGGISFESKLSECLILWKVFRAWYSLRRQRGVKRSQRQSGPQITRWQRRRTFSSFSQFLKFIPTSSGALYSRTDNTVALYTSMSSFLVRHFFKRLRDNEKSLDSTFVKIGREGIPR